MSQATELFVHQIVLDSNKAPPKVCITAPKKPVMQKTYRQHSIIMVPIVMGIIFKFGNKALLANHLTIGALVDEIYRSLILKWFAVA